MPRRSRPRPRPDRPRMPGAPLGGTEPAVAESVVSSQAPSTSVTARRAAGLRAAPRADYSYVKGELVKIAVVAFVIMGGMVALSFLNIGI